MGALEHIAFVFLSLTLSVLLRVAVSVESIAVSMVCCFPEVWDDRSSL
jgi:hypothetical protein